MSLFKKATKLAARLRAAFVGPAGSGKTYSGLAVACAIATAKGGRVAVIDSERGSASKYAGLFDFDVMELSTFSPETYVEAIHTAEREGYAVVLIDSLSHAWMGKEGALEQVDKAQKRNKGGNSFAAWRDVTPMHNALVDAMLQSPCHVIATMRAKTEYVLEENAQGKKVPRKVGLAPVQRDGLEYEFDVVGDLDLDNVFSVSKTRCPALRQAVIDRPGAEFAKTLIDWLTDGAPAPAMVAIEQRVRAETDPNLRIELDPGEMAALLDRIKASRTITELNATNNTCAKLIETQKADALAAWRAKAIGEKWVTDKSKQRAAANTRRRDEKQAQTRGAA